MIIINGEYKSSLTKAELVAYINDNATMEGLECLIEFDKKILYEYVPLEFPLSILNEKRRTWFDYLTIVYVNNFTVIFAILFNDFGSKTARNYPSSEQFYLFVNHFCEAPYYLNLYTRSDGQTKVLQDYR